MDGPAVIPLEQPMYSAWTVAWWLYVLGPTVISSDVSGVTIWDGR
jgi:hypothetical protein